jgi:tetratricopeptide (TPR) repeat protein
MSSHFYSRSGVRALLERKRRIVDRSMWETRLQLVVRALVFAALLLSGTSQTEAQDLRDSRYLEAIQKGLDHLYRLEHDQAIRFFSELNQKYPSHPGPPLTRAVSIWLKELFLRQELDLDRFISPGYFTRPAGRPMPEADRKKFFEDLARAKELSELYLERNPGDKDGRYYLGAIEGALGAFAFTIERSYMKALRHGKKSYQYQKAIVEEDPEFYDSYLTVGTYEYILGNLPWYIKWIANIAGYRGSEERGFEYLVLAAKESAFVANDARVLLMVLYVREKQYEYGLQVARQLHKRYPENFLLHLNQAQILERMEKRDEAIRIYEDVVRLSEEGQRNYFRLPLGKFRYVIGMKLLDLESLDHALEMFDAATLDHRTPHRERVFSHLRAGEILDLMGRREEAITRYQEVKRLRNIEASHKLASRYIKKPYRR